MATGHCLCPSTLGVTHTPLLSPRSSDDEDTVMYLLLRRFQHRHEDSSDPCAILKRLTITDAQYLPKHASQPT
ncbi:hypothetical protein NUW54_g12865 [Trametes sanguinea]|uniref:Uncharacterized protein n=1 Tax=Trametes sanguinea TaxID=158606 RepID=A0ACC1MTN6_9APHY|nr:hypothetical protein NUW54_g12865 [Trametes sanguinea]